MKLSFISVLILSALLNANSFASSSIFKILIEENFLSFRLSQQEEDSDSEDQIKLRNMGSNSVEHGNEVAEIVSEGDRESPREPGSPNPNWSANIRRKLNNPMSPKQSNMQKTIV